LSAAVAKHRRGSEKEKRKAGRWQITGGKKKAWKVAGQ